MDTRRKVEYFRVFLLSGCWVSGHEFRIPEFFRCSNTEKQMYLYPKMASRLEQNQRLKTLGYLLFLKFLSAVWLPNFWLLSSRQYHSPNVNHCIWVISFWPRAGIRVAGSLHLTECPVSFDHNAKTPQIAENTLPRFKPSFSEMWKCP